MCIHTHVYYITLYTYIYIYYIHIYTCIHTHVYYITLYAHIYIFTLTYVLYRIIHIYTHIYTISHDIHTCAHIRLTYIYIYIHIHVYFITSYMTVSLEIATPPKSTKSQIWDCLVKFKLGQIWNLNLWNSEESEFLDPADFGRQLWQSPLKCYTSGFHQIEKVRFPGVLRYKFKLRIWFNLNLYREIWVLWYGGCREVLHFQWNLSYVWVRACAHTLRENDICHDHFLHGTHRIDSQTLCLSNRRFAIRRMSRDVAFSVDHWKYMCVYMTATENATHVHVCVHMTAIQNAWEWVWKGHDICCWLNRLAPSIDMTYAAGSIDWRQA